MSGATLAVVPRTEPDQTEATDSHSQQKSHHLEQRRQQSKVGGVMGSLRVIELQLVAFIMVFSLSGFVPLLDLVFPLFASAYLLILSRFAFPTRCLAISESAEILHGGRIFRFYLFVGTTIGLFLPLAFVLGGFARGDNQAVRSATPQLYLLSCQILTENFLGGLTLFSPPVRALVPMLYTVRRIFVILDWVTDAWLNKTMPANSQLKDTAWFWFGRSLATVNLAYFSMNLYVFLIPQFLPRSFERYFKDRDETSAKMAEDKPLSPTASKESKPTDKKTD